MRISDWSSDVCSSDLRPARPPATCSTIIAAATALSTLARPIAIATPKAAEPFRWRGTELRPRPSDWGRVIGAERSGPGDWEQGNRAMAKGSPGAIFRLNSHPGLPRFWSRRGAGLRIAGAWRGADRKRL